MTSDQPFIPFGRPNFSGGEIEAISEVMKTGWIGMGSETLEFEKELAQYMGAPYVVTVNSCTSALFLSLYALGIGVGDEVICPSLTWCSTANSALYLGAKPVFCDVDRDTLSVTPELILQKVTQNTKAVVIVHFGGYPVDVKKLRALLPSGIEIVEDAAHALGSKYPNGQMVGSSGNLTCFSFYANKNLSTGEGGAVATTSEEIAIKIRLLRQNALDADAWKRFSHKTLPKPVNLTELGYKMNYTDLQACIGRIQLKRQVEFKLLRQEIAGKYSDLLEDCSSTISFQAGILDVDHAKHLFVVKLNIDKLKHSRDEVLSKLREKNIGASIHYAPLHLMSLYAQQTIELPNTEWLSKRIITLPISASITLGDVSRVVKGLLESIK